MTRNAGFKTINGKKIFRIFTEPDIPTKKIVIMAHGYRGSTIGPARTFVDFEQKLLAAGFAVLRFDQPGSGNSESDHINSSFQEWIDTIVFLATDFVERGYQVGLLGQSMGATATMIAAANEKLRTAVPCLLLWVPDAKTDLEIAAEEIDEEAGEQVRGQFWLEAKHADFFTALEQYPGGIHLVFGQTDRYVSNALRARTIEAVRAKQQPVMILPGQDHSSWEWSAVQKVYVEEIEFLKKYFI